MFVNNYIMGSVVHNENNIIIPPAGIIFIVAITIAAIQHFAKVDFGWVGIVAWIVVIIGAIYFVLWAYFNLSK